MNLPKEKTIIFCTSALHRLPDYSIAIPQMDKYAVDTLIKTDFMYYFINSFKIDYEGLMYLLNNKENYYFMFFGVQLEKETNFKMNFIELPIINVQGERISIDVLTDYEFEPRRNFFALCAAVYIYSNLCLRKFEDDELTKINKRIFLSRKSFRVRHYINCPSSDKALLIYQKILNIHGNFLTCLMREIGYDFTKNKFIVDTFRKITVPMYFPDDFLKIIVMKEEIPTQLLSNSINVIVL